MLVTNNTILVIDDAPADIHLLSDMLLEHGYQVIGALNGQDGLQLALKTPPKAILLDLYMPGFDGVATAKLIKSMPRLADIPILFLTGSTELAHKLQAFSAGAVDYITKPFSAAEVIARLRVHTRFHDALAQSMADEGRAKANASMQLGINAPNSLSSSALNNSLSDAHSLATAAAMTTAGAAVPLPAPALQVETAGQRLLRKATEILQADLRDPPVGTALAHAVGTNEKRLHEEFRSQLGLSVFEYLRKIRHQKACDLLLHSALPVSHIAELAGFKTAAAFTFSFRQQLGLTPTQFRAQAGVGAVQT